MDVDSLLRTILAIFLIVAVVGCGDQVVNPVIQEEDHDGLEGVPIAFLSALATGSSDDPYPNFRFRVEIDGIAQAGFCQVVMPYARMNTPEADQVGETTKQTEYGNLILMWGVTSNMELYNWFKDAAEGNIVLKNLSVIIMDEEGSDAARWNFIDASPVRYDAPHLDAMGSEVAIETLEISFESMIRER